MQNAYNIWEKLDELKKSDRTLVENLVNHHLNSSEDVGYFFKLNFKDYEGEKTAKALFSMLKKYKKEFSPSMEPTEDTTLPKKNL